MIPDNQRINRDIFIPLERTRGAVTGQKVTAEITDYGRGRKNPEGRITQILGEASDPETEDVYKRQVQSVAYWARFIERRVSRLSMASSGVPAILSRSF